MATVYLLHFDRPFKHARHYIGMTNGDINRRIEEHENGSGARLMQVIREAGIGFKIAKVWEDVPRDTEKKKKGRGASRMCPICQAERSALCPA